MTASVWTEDRVERLKLLWLEGRSAEQIAHALSCATTRSAVLGKVYRLGLSAGRSPRLGRRPSPGVRTRAPSRAISATVAPGSVEPLAERGEETLLSVRHRQCRWPLGDPRKADFSVCGRPVCRGAYCGAHAAIAYRKPRQSLEALVGLN